MLGMFIIGLGLGQLMQSLTLAAQNAVAPSYMGVASSAATFFRQIGGTMGTAVLLSVLFSAMPGNIMKAMGNEDDLRSGLDAALTPAVASAPENQGIMEQMWNQIVEPAQSSIASQLSTASDQARTAADDAVYQQVSAAVQAQVDAGTLPADQAQTFIDAQVSEATPAAEEAALASAAEQAHASVQDGTLVVDWSDEAQRSYWVDQLTPPWQNRFLLPPPMVMNQAFQPLIPLTSPVRTPASPAPSWLASTLQPCRSTGLASLPPFWPLF